MKVRVKLMGALKAKTPDGGAVDIADGADINAVLAALQIAPEQVQVVMVNGRPEPNRNRSLSADDDLTVLAPVGGG